jgi:ribonuclease III
LGRGEELTRGRQKTSLLADAMEAVLAAVYLDGGLDPVRELTLRAFQPEFQDVKNRLEGDDSIALLDYKTQLQEWCQKQFEGLPQYVTVRETGPDHQKTFEVQLSIQGDVVGLGVGRTKKEAEQMAAKQGLRHVIEYDD